MNNKPLSSVIKSIVLGYVLIYFHINLGTIDILPDWAGYLLIVSALPFLAEKEKSAMLLKPLGIILALWKLVVWISAIMGMSIDVYIINVIISILSIYLNFQLITNIAALPIEASRKKRLLSLRSATVIIHTLTAILLAFPEISQAAIVSAVFQVVMCVWIVIELGRLATALKEEEDTEGEYSFGDDIQS